MPIRLRDRQVNPWMQPGGRFITISSTAMKWTGLLLTCVSSLGIAVFQRGLLKMDTYATAEDFTAAVADPANGLSGWTSAAVTCSLIAAMALPIYAKLIYEGWKRVTDQKTFFLRLALCALVSEIPFDLAMSGKFLEFEIQNPVWSLLLCAAMLEVFHIPKPSSKAASALLQIVILAGALAWAVLMRFYMSTSLVLLVALFYFLEGNRLLATVGGVLFTMPQFPAPFGMLFVHWFEADEEKDAKFPNLFYILYPVQLLIFGIVGMILARTA